MAEKTIAETVKVSNIRGPGRKITYTISVGDLELHQNLTVSMRLVNFMSSLGGNIDGLSEAEQQTLGEQTLGLVMGADNYQKFMVYLEDNADSIADESDAVSKLFTEIMEKVLPKVRDSVEKQAKR